MKPLITKNRKRTAQRAQWKLLALCIFLLLSLSCVRQSNSTGDKALPNPHLAQIQDKNQPDVAPGERQSQDYVSNQVLVKFKAGTEQHTIDSIQYELYLTTIREFSSPNLYLMKIPDASTVEKIIENLIKYEEVQYAEPNYVIKANDEC